jgi:FTR1 family protein
MEIGNYFLPSLSSSLFIIVREGIEILLLLMIILKLTESGHKRYVYLGSLLGILSSILVAYLFVDIFEHSDLELFEGYVQVITGLMLLYISVWCVNANKHINEHLQYNNSMAFVLVSFFTILREGVEVVLFYFSLYTSVLSDVLGMLFGFLIGISMLVYIGTRINNFNTKYIFKASSYVFPIFALYFLSSGIHEFAEYYEVEWLHNILIIYHDS